MNLSNEVNVKNFHVLDAGHVATPVESSNGEVYFLVADGDGNNLYATDKFRLADVKYAKVSKPSVPEFKKWEITIPTDEIVGLKPGFLMTVYMHFTNLYGYGITDRWEKFATVAVTKSMVSLGSDGLITGWATDGKKAFANKLADQINAQYVAKDMQPVQATAADDGSKITIEDTTYEQQKRQLTRRALEKGFQVQPIEMYITTNILEGADESWCAEVRNAANKEYKHQYDGDTDSTKELKNAYLIWQMEKVSALNSHDVLCSKGFLGYDTVMDSKDLNEDYHVLDIQYETLPKAGMPASRNLKGLSFASTSQAELEGLLDEVKKDDNVLRYTITAVPNDSKYGKVKGGGKYRENATATLTANANTGYQFSKWDDEDTNNPRTVKVTGTATYTAIFEEA